MANKNQFPGLARGPIDHKGNSVINVIAENKIDMGAVVLLIAPTSTDELLPQVREHAETAGDRSYGIVVGGDNDGVYGNGVNSPSDDDSNRASSAAGQSVVVVTQGRCLAKVDSTSTSSFEVVVGSPLTPSGSNGTLQLAKTGNNIIAVALQEVDITSGASTDMIAVDVQREGPL